MKRKRFLWILLLFSLGLVFSGCDIYRAFKENRVIVAFLNEKLNPWLAREHVILNQYNQLIAGENFSSETLWDDLETNLLPAVLKLREEIGQTEVTREDLSRIKKLFLDKLDLMLEGLGLLREGLKKTDDDSLETVYRGRDKLKEVSRYNYLIELEVSSLKKEFFIEEEDLGKKEESGS